jgi:hypothetical protein
MKKLSLSILLSCILSICMLKVASAATPTNSGIAVSPAIEQIALGAGQSSASFKVEVINNNSVAVTLQASSEDFTALNTSGSVAFLGNSSSASPHGLAYWISPIANLITIAPDSSQSVSVSITNTNTLPLGGHYGAVIFKALPSVSSARGNNLTANEGIATLVFLTTHTGGVQAVTLDTPDVGSVLTTLPSSIDLVLNNTGNTQTAPRGVVTISDRSGKIIARGIINIDSGLVLPDTTRLYDVNLNYLKSSFLPGNYHLNINYEASNNSVLLTYTKSFVYINPLIIWVVAAALVVLIALIIRRLRPKPDPRPRIWDGP